MVQLVSLSQAAAMAFLLFSSTTVGQGPQPLTAQQVNDTIISMTAQAKAISTTAQSISAKYSCWQLGFTGVGPLKVSSANHPIVAIPTNQHPTRRK